MSGDFRGQSYVPLLPPAAAPHTVRHQPLVLKACDFVFQRTPQDLIVRVISDPLRDNPVVSEVRLQMIVLVRLFQSRLQ